MIYLASPYTSTSLAEQQYRFEAVCRHASQWMRRGLYVYSPIAHTHPIALRGGLPGDWSYWERFDRWFIERCDLVAVLMLPGWEGSEGVQAAIRMARELHKPVIYLTPEVPDEFSEGDLHALLAEKRKEAGL